MISKARLKEIKTLQQPKFRQIYNKFIAEGDKVCIEFLKNQKFKINQILISSGSEVKYNTYVKHLTVDTDIISTKEMEQISALKTASDILLLLEKKEDNISILFKSEASAIYLDGVQDPGNVGTIIRIADWFGVNAVIRSNESADFFNPKVVQASMGSMVNTLLITSDIKTVSSYNKPMYGTYLEGIEIKNLKMEPGAILVLGSEGKGVSAMTEPYIHKKLTIPGAPHKIAESLNVSVAAGIICEHWKN